MISESIPNPSVGVRSVWPCKGICQFNPVIVWDTTRTLCLHVTCFLYFYIYIYIYIYFFFRGGGGGGGIIVIFNFGYGESF